MGGYPAVVTRADEFAVSMNYEQGIFWGILAVMGPWASEYAMVAMKGA